MDYDRIILEMLERIKLLEEQVSSIQESYSLSGNDIADERRAKSSKKYRRLTEYLSASGGKPVTLTFREIENIIGFALPDSAKAHRAYWANSTTHSIALSWMCVGYKTVDVNLNTETIIFER